MIKRTVKSWIPFWGDKWLFGSMRIEFDVTERGIWWDLMALAMKDDGYIRANENTPYLPQQLAGMLIIPEGLLIKTIDKFVTAKKYVRLKNGTLKIKNWEKYCFTDRHMRRVQEQGMSAESDTMSENEDRQGEVADTRKEKNGIDKNRKEKKGASFPKWLPKEEFNEYQKMRKKIKKPMTDRAVELAIKKLEQLKNEGNDPKAVLEQSIYNSWQGLFPLKDSEQKASQVGQSSQKTTPEREKYYQDRRAKEAEMRAKYKKEFEEIRKKGDPVAGEALEQKIQDEMTEWSRGYLGEQK